MLSKICDKIVFSGIIFLLVFAPLAFGSVHVWAYSIVEIVVFALAGVFAIGRICTAESGEFTWVKTPVNLLLIGFILLIGFQLVPLPMSWISAVSPKTAELKTNTARIVNEMESLSVSRTSSTLSHNPHATIREALKLLSYLFMFFLVLNTVDSKKRMNILVLTIVCLGLFEALYAIFQVFSLSPRVWWWKSRAGGGRYASGTFVWPNHFAGYMEISLCMAWGYVLTLKKKTSRMESGLGGIRAGFQRMLGWFSPESVQPKKILFIFMAVIMGVALLLSASRGGILCVSLAMLVMAGMFLLRKKHAKIGLMSLFFCLVTFFYGLSIGIDPTLEKFEKTRGLFNRIDVSKTLVPMIRDYPLTGVGWGNYPDLYPRYAGKHQALSYYNGYAHNDWLEAGTEVGIPGLILMGAVFFRMFVRMAGVWRRRRNTYAVGIAAGVMAAMVSLGFHSLFDFNMHIPANPLTLAAVLGLGYVVLHHRGYGYGLSFFYRKGRFAMPVVLKPVYGAAALIGMLLLIYPAARHWAAEANCPTEWNSTMNLDRDPRPEDIEAAIRQNPKNAEYSYKLAIYYMQAAFPSSPDRAEKQEPHAVAADSLKKAVLLNPGRGKYWHALGRACENRKDDIFRYLNHWIPLADQCHDMAVYLAPHDPDILLNAAWYWVWRAVLLPERADDMDKDLFHPVQTRKQGIERFQSCFREYLSIRPGQWKRCVNRVSAYFDDDAVVMGIIPEDNAKMRSGVIRYRVGRGS